MNIVNLGFNNKIIWMNIVAGNSPEMKEDGFLPEKGSPEKVSPESLAGEDGRNDRLPFKQVFQYTKR